MLVLQNQDPFDTLKGKSQKSYIDCDTNKGRQFLNLGLNKKKWIQPLYFIEVVGLNT